MTATGPWEWEEEEVTEGVGRYPAAYWEGPFSGRDVAAPGAGAVWALSLRQDGGEMSDKMALPEGMTCGDCLHWSRCLAFICTLSPAGVRCDWSPSRFRMGHTAALARERALVETLTLERDGARMRGYDAIHAGLKLAGELAAAKRQMDRLHKEGAGWADAHDARYCEMEQLRVALVRIANQAKAELDGDTP